MALIEIDWKPNERHLRGFGTACVAAFAAIGAWVMWRHSILGLDLRADTAWSVALTLWALSAVCGVLRWTAPGWLRPLYIGLMAASLPIGLVMSHMVVGIVFFGVVTPIALLFRLMGRDSLRRKFDRSASTYWVPRRSVRDVARYYRQF
jgi:saxitoxin biosynthesis operon SxtJ-like protein